MPLYDDSDGLPVDEDNDEMEEKVEDNTFEKLEPENEDNEDDDGGEE